MQNKEVLLVGGPADGKRLFVPNRSTPIVYSETPTLPSNSNPCCEVPLPHYTHYIIDKFRGQDKIFWIGRPSYGTVDETIEKLIAGYKS